MPKSKIGNMKPAGLLAVVLFAMAFVFAGMPMIIDSAIQLTLLALIGIIVGFMTISVKERSGFLLVSLVFAVMGGAVFAVFPNVGDFLHLFFANILAAFAPFAMLTALWELGHMTKDK